MIGSAKGNAGAVEMLLGRGADKNRVLMHHGRIPMTPLDAAHQSAQKEMADMLIGLSAKLVKI